MREYARQRGLKRVMSRVPVPHRRASRACGSAGDAALRSRRRKLIESIRHPTVCATLGARSSSRFTHVSVAESIARALGETTADRGSRWSTRCVRRESRSWKDARFGRRYRLADRLGARLPRRLRSPSGASAGRGWYAFAGSGSCAASLDLLARGVGTPPRAPPPEACAWATPWTSGAWRPSSPTAACGCARR
jgi:hypothetical protein